MKSEPSRRRIVILTLTIVMSILLAACQAAEPQVEPTPAPTVAPPPSATAAPAVDVAALYNVQWALAAYGDPANPTVPPRSIQITAVFTPEGQLSGNNGCNNYSASYTATPDGFMSIEPTIAMTMMACPEEQMNAEAAYMEALAKVTAFNFTGSGDLVIRYETASGDEGLLVYVRGAVPLVATNWLLVSYGDPVNPTAALPGLPVTATFSEDGTLSGNSSCNTYTTSYEVDGEALSVAVIASTMRFCTEGMEQEAAYLAALGWAESFQITGQTLVINYLMDGRSGILTYSSATLPLVSTLWTLTTLGGVPVPEETAVTALFSPQDENGVAVVSGLAACNNYSGDYTLDESSMTIGPLATTFMLCEEELNQLEQSYLQALESTESYEIMGNILLLNTASGLLNFVADRTPLEGALWQLAAIGDVDNPEPPVEGANFTAQFIRNASAPSGIVQGTTGCNEYSAVFAASVNGIKINAPASTGTRSCPPGLNRQEQQYFLALNDATLYTILGDTLILPYDEGKQALVFQATQLEIAERPPLSDLNGSFWYLWSINDQPVLPGATITAALSVNPDGTSGQMDGSAGCNTYQADFGAEMAVQATVTSALSCGTPAGVMTQEQSYLDVLQRSYGYWQTGDQLIINSGTGALTYRTSQPPAANDQTHLLVNQTWFLISAGVNFSQPGDREPSTRFNTDGTLNGYTGCNDFTGQYTTAPGQITISAIANTLTACPNTALQTQEQSMLALLGSAQTYRIVDITLQIVSPQGVLNYSLTPLSRPEEAIPPTPVIQSPATAPVNTSVTFDASASTGQVPIVRYSWEFGDGNRRTGTVVQNVYTAPGDYRVVMTAIDQRNLQSTTTTNITILAPNEPTPQPTPPPQPTDAPQATPPPQATQAPQPTAVPPTAVPPTPEPPIEPPSVPPTAAMSAPQSAFIGEPVAFSAAGSSPGSSPITSYQWNFGDGSITPPSASPDTSYLFSHGGSYQVSVTVTDASGLSSSASQQVNVDARLDTVVWSLSPTQPGTVITLQFLRGQVAGFAGCNTYTGSYTAMDNGDGTFSVTTSGLTFSRMACPQAIMDQETEYFNALTQVTTARLQGNSLVLTHPGGALNYFEVGTGMPR